MTPVDIIGSQAGRVLRVLAGAAMIAAGRRRGGPRGQALSIAGLVPLSAGAADVCLLGPLVGGPLRGAAFRDHRARRRSGSR